MAYTNFTLDTLSAQIGSLLDDTGTVQYWPTLERYYAIWEAMRVWGALTSYWRTRGSFSLSPNQPYYLLPEILTANPPYNNIRTRNWTLDQLTQQIQYHLLEAANGISGAGMSTQVSIASILNAIKRARNRFALDSHLPVSVLSTPYSPPPSQGEIVLDQSVVFLHRAAWQDTYSGSWQNLWQEDAWAVDHSYPQWTNNPGMPQAYSESENAPLFLQLYPAPSLNGSLETINVQSLDLDITNPNSTFNIPDEWIHAVKFAALLDLFSADSQLNDPLRAQYCAMRYEQAVDAAQEAKSIIRCLLNGVPLPIDTLSQLDTSMPTWRNQSGQPYSSAILYDFLTMFPVPDAPYGLALDMVQCAPLPIAGTQPINGDGVYVQIGSEDIPHIIDYAKHLLLLKCGGKEFQATFSDYDSFMSAVGGRGQINKTKIRYYDAMLNQWVKEESENPDQMPTPALAGAK